jgi:hypothetical protein
MLIHNNYYDYSKFHYTNNRTKGLIICPQHGEFAQSSKCHLRGHGCPKCGRINGGNLKRGNTDDFIKRAAQIHQNKYDYTNSKYAKNNVPIHIICPVHGEFHQTPNAHLAGNGCPKCAIGRIKTKLKTSNREFIAKSMAVHGERYNYSNINYVNNKINVEIICKIHGSFFQTPQCHIQQTQGCPKCGLIKCGLAGRGNTDGFINQANVIHGNYYDYSLTNYIKSNVKICIICPKHGKFYQKPNAHLMGQGCPVCSDTISKPEINFLDYLHLLPDHRQWKIRRYHADGIEENTIYEFLGDYWHGNPVKYAPDDYNQRAHKTFGELYQNTIKKFQILKSLNYKVKYIWESDWVKFKRGDDKSPRILEYSDS